MFRFDLGPLLQGQTRIAKVVLEFCHVKPACRKSWPSLGLHLGSLHQGQTSIAKVKSAYNSIIIGLRGLRCETICRKSWDRNLLTCSDLTFGPWFKVKLQ